MHNVDPSEDMKRNMNIYYFMYWLKVIKMNFFRSFTPPWPTVTPCPEWWRAVMGPGTRWATACPPSSPPWGSPGRSATWTACSPTGWRGSTISRRRRCFRRSRTRTSGFWRWVATGVTQYLCWWRWQWKLKPTEGLSLLSIPLSIYCQLWGQSTEDKHKFLNSWIFTFCRMTVIRQF